VASVFSKIIAGEIPAYKVAETEDFLAFLDVRPVAKGHVLCIPKKDVDYIFDIDDESYVKLMLFSKIVATGIKLVVPCKKIGVTVIGLEVPHAHVHLVPMNELGDMNFAGVRPEFTKEEFEKLTAEIKAAITSL
jgi:histidine triad (HIT) family protein